MNRIIFTKIVIVCCFSVPTVYSGETYSSFEEIQKKPPIERIQTQLSILRDSRIPLDIKNQFLGSFAQSARNLSNQYGKSSIKMNEVQWIEYLSEGIKVLPENQNVVSALTQLLINNQQYERTLDVLNPYHKKHPCHETTAWIEYCESQLSQSTHGDDLLIFDVHFCVLTKNPEARKECTLEQFKREILILNRTFLTLNRNPLVKFRFKSVTFYEDIKADQSLLEQMTNNEESFDSNKFNEYYNQCKNPKIRDMKALNFYIYDSYSSQDGYKDITSHGRRNSNHPYILLDWQRLNNNVQNPSAHEMGHAFGLGHVAVPGANINTPTNIMCSTEYGFGSGGNRRLGFTEAQAAIILYHAERTKQKLSVSDP